MPFASHFIILRRKRWAFEITNFDNENTKINRSNTSEFDLLHSNNQRSGYEERGESEHHMTDELFLNEYADIQYDDFESIVSSIAYLNLDPVNFEK